MSFINVNAAPRIEVIDSAGQILDSDQSAVAFSLPDYGLQFALKPELVDSHEDAQKYAAGIRLLGYEDWRLPTRKELELLLSMASHRPATWPALVEHTPTDDWYWTADLLASFPGCAWFVYFNDGLVHYGRRNGGGFVRAVRSVSPSQ